MKGCCSFFFLLYLLSFWYITNYTFCFSLVEFFLSMKENVITVFYFIIIMISIYYIFFSFHHRSTKKIRSLEISDSIKQKKLCLIWSFLITVFLNSHAIHFFVLLSWLKTWKLRIFPIQFGTEKLHWTKFRSSTVIYLWILEKFHFYIKNLFEK